MSRGIGPDKDEKRQQAQNNLNELQRVLEKMEYDKHEQSEDKPEVTPEEGAVEEESIVEGQTMQEDKSMSEDETTPEDESISEDDVVPESEGSQPVAEDSHGQHEEQPDHPAETDAPEQKSDKDSEDKPARDVQADMEQLQREAILDAQVKRLHLEQAASEAHADAQKSAAKKAAVKQPASGKKTHAVKNTRKSKARAARRRKKRLIRLGTMAVMLLVAVVLVVSAVRAITGRGNSPTEGSGISAGTSEKKDDRPASQQESEQYLKIKDDASLPSYALEYPGLYADAVDEPNQKSEEKVCYLTFDDGPSSTNTPDILDVLKEKDVKATFFVVTGKIDGNEDILKRIVDEGHTLCIHANEHEYGQLYSSVEGYLEDFVAAYDKIYEITGYRVQGFRFPGGSNNAVMERHDTYDTIVTEMTRRGFEYYDWNAYDHDAENRNYSAQQLADFAVNEVCASSRDDAILLMHDTYGKEKTVEALPLIIERLQEEGIDLLPITNSTRPVHFEVSEQTPPEMPETDSDSDSTEDSEDTNTSEN